MQLIYSHKKKTWVEATKWLLFKRKITCLIQRFKIVDTYKYKVIKHSDMSKYFSMSNDEYQQAEEIYKKDGTISYEFYPIGGIGWGLKIHKLDKNNEIIDITDLSKL